MWSRRTLLFGLPVAVIVVAAVATAGTTWDAIPSPTGAPLPSGAPPVGGWTRQAVADRLREAGVALGLSEVQIAAVIANAIAESDLNPNVCGDSGESCGVFQIRALPGRTLPDRADPVASLVWMFMNEIIQRQGQRFRAQTDPGLAAAYFGIDLERPSDRAEGGKTFLRRQWLGSEVFAGRLPSNYEAWRRFP